MFGLLIPNRPIQPSPQQAISETQYAFTIPAAPSFSHLAVFLLPNQNLPSDALAAIYIKLPAGPPDNDGFRLLGALANDKQSAVFRLSGLAGSGGGANDSAASGTGVREEIMLDDATGEPVQAAHGADVVVGISVEPAATVQAQLAAMRAQAAGAPAAGGGQLVRAADVPGAGAMKEAARRIGQNVFNFMSGFASGPAGQEVVPLKSVQEWWNKFEKKIDMDVGFLMRDGG